MTDIQEGRVYRVRFKRPVVIRFPNNEGRLMGQVELTFYRTSSPANQLYYCLPGSPYGNLVTWEDQIQSIQPV